MEVIYTLCICLVIIYVSNSNSHITIRALNPNLPTKAIDYFFFHRFGGFWVMFKYCLSVVVSLMG